MEKRTKVGDTRGKEDESISSNTGKKGTPAERKTPSPSYLISKSELKGEESKNKKNGEESENLDGQSYLMSSRCEDYFNSIKSSGPLLGSRQLNKYLHDKNALVQITTWNMGSLPLPDEERLNRIFQHEFDDSGDVDVHVIAIQECWPDVDAWELEMQMCLGYDYALYHSLSHGTLHISIFMRRDLLWFTTEISEFTLTVRSGRLFKTKGSVGISLGLFGSRYLFINAHLSAGQGEEREQLRKEELKKIIVNSQKGPNSYDAVFLCGDLNFRISRLTREEILGHLAKNDFVSLLDMDELNRLFLRSLSKAFKGFQEAASITFRPTYKYDLGTEIFDTSNKKRSPAYTDRIIYKCYGTPDDAPAVTCLAYESIANVRISDHRPVYALFHLKIKPGFDTMPITGARYKRELYVKAVQKQARYLLERRKKLASSACTIS